MSCLIRRDVHTVHPIGWLRAAVLGVNDGLVSTASPVAGMGASGAAKPEALLAGLADPVGSSMSPRPRIRLRRHRCARDQGGAGRRTRAAKRHRL
ncbi:VIT1/CCC1 transporter family protein [Histidinibacterium aquaticum]|uniref:Uncharacterized protein n=1 Tax=Histidinibacterium aquaticum TaxID=2613962 RepID=A0A5J5GA62_9RHOB|nr:VIT1/CCC1 transporter family protein [Histidinibacterium aquaticum]KAA9004987.1 hypothetical protein F3S47_18960 [Histidinibacterium aquaticum]